MPSRQFFVVGLTHIDLAWKKDREEHEEILEAAIVRLLDVLDNHPYYTYLLEQAAHFHSLAKRRPDLIARLRSYVQDGRLEFVGGLASTLETNGPSGESFVRNQLLGHRSVLELFGAPIKTGYLIDTFGIHAQVPQILRQFGLGTLLANRFGGILEKDTFFAKGLDGSRVLVAGRDVNSTYVSWDRVFFGFIQENKHISSLFEKAGAAATEGPHLVVPYTEYDGIARTYVSKLLKEQRTGGGNAEWRFATLSAFFDALVEYSAEWPEYEADLNPEFTGTFGLRAEIRSRHRSAENLLMDSEKWATLLTLPGWNATSTADCWWNMAFAQSHDVFSGSHPTSVFRDTMAQLAEAETKALAVFKRSIDALGGQQADRAEIPVVALNSLPWDRDAIVTVSLPQETKDSTIVAVLDGSRELPFEVEGGLLHFRGSFSGISAKTFIVKQASPSAGLAAEATPVVRKSEAASVAGQGVTVTADLENGLRIMVPDAAGGVRAVKVEITLQEDRGNFQIENLVGSEISSNIGLSVVDGPHTTSLRKQVSIHGRFPSLWTPNPLDWEMTCTVYPDKPQVDLAVGLHWRGEASRLRLKIGTEFESSTGIFEVPFGAVRRVPYLSRRTARGEWPVHRWVAIEEAGQGVALINKGNMGAEVMGGTIWTTLLRAPVSEYAGMVSDDTSSQHGDHRFEFSILPYEGSWTTGACIELAQELNSPCYAVPTETMIPEGSLASLAPSTVVLSCIKPPEDDAPGEVIVRFYEAVGRRTQASLYLKGAQGACRSDLREARGDAVTCSDGWISLTVEPFEITTLRVKLSAAAGTE